MSETTGFRAALKEAVEITEQHPAFGWSEWSLMRFAGDILTTLEGYEQWLREARDALEDDHKPFDSKREQRVYCTACGGTWPCLGVTLQGAFPPADDPGAAPPKKGEDG